MIKNFDFHLCKFAIDSETLYTSSTAVHEFLQMVINFTGAQKRNENLIMKRLLKYNKKGFWVSNNISERLWFDTSEMKDQRISIYQDTSW